MRTEAWECVSRYIWCGKTLCFHSRGQHVCLWLKGKIAKMLATRPGAGGPCLHLLLKIKSPLRNTPAGGEK